MKKIIITILTMLFCIVAIGQPTSTGNQLSKYDYQNKSIKQKRTAWLFLGLGGTVALGGAASLIYLGTVDDPSPELKSFAIGMTVLGAAGMVASIPFFKASARNKSKAMDMSLNLGFEKSLALKHSWKTYDFYPALSFRFRFK